MDTDEEGISELEGNSEKFIKTTAEINKMIRNIKVKLRYGKRRKTFQHS